MTTTIEQARGWLEVERKLVARLVTQKFGPGAAEQLVPVLDSPKTSLSPLSAGPMREEPQPSRARASSSSPVSPAPPDAWR